MQMKPEVGAEMSLFGGNVIGKVISVERPREIVTTWRAPTWPAGKTFLPDVSLERSLYRACQVGDVDKVNIRDVPCPLPIPGHFGKLKTSLVQGSDSTNLELYLTGVPVGTEEETERNLDICQSQILIRA
jgi:activator of HSP90 ATPase